MSFKIKLYTFSKKINSTAQPTGGTELTCLIKSPSSIMNPVVELNVNPMAYNYAYISEFSRYYFINDIRFDKGLWICSLNIDVLATYKTTIGSTSSYVLRASAAHNEYLIDKAVYLTGKLSGGGASIIEAHDSVSYDSGVYVITTSGSSNANGKTLYQLTAADFKTFISTLMTTADGYDFGDLTQGLINSLVNPLDYITSVMWFPVAFTTSGTDTIQCGLWNSGVTASKISTYANYKRFTVTIPKHPQASTYGKYCNLAPFSSYDLDLGIAGIISLDPSMLIDATTMTVNIIADPMTGNAKCEAHTLITAGGSLREQELFNIGIQYGVPVPMTQTTTNLTNFVSDSISLVKSAATDDMIGVVSDTVSLVGSAVKSLQGSVSSKGTIASISAHQQPYRLLSRFFEIAARDTANAGRPLCDMRTISTLSGFQQIANSHVAISGTSTEASMINSYLESGFYYE